PRRSSRGRASCACSSTSCCRAARTTPTRASPPSSAAGSAARRSSAWPSRSSAASTPATPSGCRCAPPCPVSSRSSDATGASSSAPVTLGYRSTELPRGLPGFGFVVPAVERRPILACSYPSRKFAGRAPDGHDLVRAFVGGALRADLLELDDERLTALVEAELAHLLG